MAVQSPPPCPTPRPYTNHVIQTVGPKRSSLPGAGENTTFYFSILSEHFVVKQCLNGLLFLRKKFKKSKNQKNYKIKKIKNVSENLRTD